MLEAVMSLSFNNTEAGITLNEGLVNNLQFAATTSHSAKTCMVWGNNVS